MGSHGRVPDGAVGRDVLRTDPVAPFGVRLSPTAVEDAFTASWHDKSVVLVEGSDLLRAERLRPFSSPLQRDRQRQRAIRWTDELVARLLSHVDLSRDAVLVVAPVASEAQGSLTVAGLRAPGVAPGLLRTATTRRSGFVTLADLGPTVLDVLGITPPETMEGRPVKVGREGGTSADRREFLVTANADALVRDRLVNPATSAVVWTSVILMAASVFFLRRYRWVGEAIRWVALGLIGFLVATLVAAVVHFGIHGGITAYWAFVSVFAVAFALVCRRLGRSATLDPLLIALGVPRRRHRGGPAHRLAPRLQHGVRVLGHDRHPVLRDREPDVLAARRGRHRPRGARVVAVAGPLGNARCDRHPRDLVHRVDAAALRRGLRRHPRRRAIVPPARVAPPGTTRSRSAWFSRCSACSWRAG